MIVSDPPTTPAPDCLICRLEDAPDEVRVFRDDRWAAEVAPGFEVPGWFFLRTRRHAELVTGLDADEAALLGPRTRDLTAAVFAATGAAAVYAMNFGEGFRHYHAIITARAPDVPVASRRAHIFDLVPDAVDPAAAIAAAAKVRDAYRALRRD